MTDMLYHVPPVLDLTHLILCITHYIQHTPHLSLAHTTLITTGAHHTHHHCHTHHHWPTPHSSPLAHTTLITTGTHHTHHHWHTCTSHSSPLAQGTYMIIYLMSVRVDLSVLKSDNFCKNCRIKNSWIGKRLLCCCNVNSYFRRQGQHEWTLVP